MWAEHGERERLCGPPSAGRTALRRVGRALALAGGAFGAVVFVLADPLELIASGIAAVFAERSDRSEGGTSSLGEMRPPTVRP